MVEAMAQLGIAGNMPVVPLTIDAPLEQRLAYADMCEAGIGAVLDAFASGVPDAVGVTTTTTTITGADGNDVTLYISRPAVDGPLPAIVHLHGGGMAIASAADSMYFRIREHLAGTGLVVVGVEFRNSGKAWPTQVSGRIERLRVGRAVGRGASRRARRESSDRVR